MPIPDVVLGLESRLLCCALLEGHTSKLVLEIIPAENFGEMKNDTCPSREASGMLGDGLLRVPAKSFPNMILALYGFVDITIFF